MSVPWVRMSGAGNELIILDAIARPDLAARTDLAALAVAMCDPETGIGADSLLILSRDARDAMRMRVINADGGTSAMCGNGLRCLARHAVEHGYVDDAMFAIITDAGPRAIRVNDGIASV
ncbi:MAG: hypothetical protein KDA25_07580, partial [Phycisphaerales bacterium]|nr:hypothetical protein [Phycisphaerales bacterium]